MKVGDVWSKDMLRKKKTSISEIEILKNRIIESIKLLASEGEVQLSCFPDFVCKGDEIANSLGDWLLMYKNIGASEAANAFLPDELKQIISIDEYISELEPRDFSDEAIINSYKWRIIREKANAVLYLLKVDYSLPDKRSV